MTGWIFNSFTTQGWKFWSNFGCTALVCSRWRNQRSSSSRSVFFLFFGQSDQNQRGLDDLLGAVHVIKELQSALRTRRPSQEMETSIHWANKQRGSRAGPTLLRTELHSTRGREARGGDELNKFKKFRSKQRWQSGGKKAAVNGRKMPEVFNGGSGKEAEGLCE